MPPWGEPASVWMEGILFDVSRLSHWRSLCLSIGMWDN